MLCLLRTTQRQALCTHAHSDLHQLIDPWHVLQVLRTAVDADETLPSYDDLDDKAKELVEDFRERQWMISQGHLSMENSMDDFRVVVGDNTL